MGKKKNTRAVVVTIIITLIVLAGLSYAGVKYLLPIYTQGQYGSGDAMADVYKFAVKLFPLLVGIVLIIIASLIASSRDDEEDDEDKLPPNSYDNQLFEEPSDDPTSKKSSPAVKSEPEFTPEEEQAFVSIFDAPISETAQPAEPEFSGIEKDDTSKEDVAEEEPKAAEPVATKTSEKEDALIAAIYSLVKKLDDMSDMSEDDVEFDEEDFTEDEEEFEELDSVEAPQCPASCNISALEDKVNSLCDIVTNLSKLVSHLDSSAIPAEENAEEEEEEPVEEVTEEVVEEEIEEASEEPEVVEPAPVEETVEEEPVVQEEAPAVEETPVEEEITIEEPVASNEVERFTKIEFESAQNDAYDISFVFTDASMDDVALNLSGLGDAFEVNGKTFIIVPFLSNDEVKAELEKLGAPYELKTVVGGETADFDEVVGSKLK